MVEVLKKFIYVARSGAYLLSAFAWLFIGSVLVGIFTSFFGSLAENAAVFYSIILVYPLVIYLAYKAGRNAYWSWNPSTVEKHRLGLLIVGMALVLGVTPYGIGFLIAWHQKKPNPNEEFVKINDK